MDPAYDTCWKIWLAYQERMCPFLPDIGHISPKLEFLELLAAAGHSYIVKVRFDGNIFALKLYTLTQPHWSPSRFVINALEMDPFIIECRVYDSLIENNLTGVVGPYCHGWLTIDRDQEDGLQIALRKTLNWRRRSDTDDSPICGLLLEYVHGCTLEKAYITPAGTQSLREQLGYLHSLDIIHGDLFPRNVMVSEDGRAFLVDFSSACLWPTNRAIVRKRETFDEYKEDEKSILELFFFRLQNVSFPFPRLFFLTSHCKTVKTP
ncbi:predicted protein [Uncinocarpus reesii 1704]|uniref:Protein kinase domain-containing protein n=1 Tax=Uncinocarpus reesii (strain UAMH 1704) TaxID=336963 RepID=C4JSN5_UNCRE|nr:uncharacterized protein UREG_05474 [Uncinocarpus reesii 1704]EEP80632.1 predicted protein [Uncinocarpus reesii 1704]